MVLDLGNQALFLGLDVLLPGFSLECVSLGYRSSVRGFRTCLAVFTGSTRASSRELGKSTDWPPISCIVSVT